MKANTCSKKIEEILGRGVENIYPDKESLKKVLMSGKKIRLYNGFDPTGELHIGHLIILKKLRQFQDLGHEVIVLLGDFTATIGDPTDKLAARKPLTRKQVLENAKSYKKQIGKVLDLKKSNIKFLYNEKWTNELKPADLLEIFSHFTVARLLERDMFQKRIKEGREILLHEFVYPVFQAYDSAVMDVDLEIGGNDQTFNMLRGRDLMKKMKNKEKFVMSLKLLADPAGKKMSKTEGNAVDLNEEASQMFGKIMSWPDSFLPLGFELLTDVSLSEIKEILKNPRQAKAELARQVVLLCHGKKEAERAEKEFDAVFKKKELPLAIPEVEIKESSMNILELIVKTGIAGSRAEAKRLILQKGIKIEKEAQNDWQKKVEIKKGMVVQLGRRKFIKII